MNLLPRKVLTLPRHPGDALRLLAGMAILLACTATVRPDDVGVARGPTCSGWSTTSRRPCSRRSGW